MMYNEPTMTANQACEMPEKPIRLLPDIAGETSELISTGVELATMIYRVLCACEPTNVALQVKEQETVSCLRDEMLNSRALAMRLNDILIALKSQFIS